MCRMRQIQCKTHCVLTFNFLPSNYIVPSVTAQVLRPNQILIFRYGKYLHCLIASKESLQNILFVCTSADNLCNRLFFFSFGNCTNFETILQDVCVLLSCLNFTFPRKTGLDRCPPRVEDATKNNPTSFPFVQI